MKKIFFYLFIFLMHQYLPCVAQDAIQQGSLSVAGFDSIVISKMESDIQKAVYPNIHSLLIARHHKLVYEKYWPGKDEMWGENPGIYIHAKDSLHDIRSISKSIVSACVGIAIKQGKIKSVHQKIFDFFPEYAKQDTGLKSLLTIEHLLSMSSGLVWNEDVPYNNPENSEIRMIRSSDPVEYVVTQPMEAAPGKIWKYNGGTTQLLAAIIEKTTGKKVDQFANMYLFQPLGITKFQWIKYPGTDLPAAASGLRLTSRDLLKFGLLYNQKGIWNNKQILDPAWIQESFQMHVHRGKDISSGYGYQFWLWSDSMANKIIPFVVAVGNGDQRIFIDQSNDLVIVITAGNYNKWDIEKNSSAILRDYIYPALKK